MKQIVLATRNYDKVREFRGLLRDIPVRILSYDDFPNFPETAVIEDGNTFAQNALKKARAVCAITGKIALADDSGLEV
jgi:Xanthosine triphosphate pyrophosphatase